MSYIDFSLTDLSKYKIIFISGKNAQGKSTLTSEAPFFSLFGSSLRYSKIGKLLSWYYDPLSNEPAFSELGLKFDMHSYSTIIKIKRNIIDESRYELVVDNDIENNFFDLTAISKVPDFNKEIKNILDIDERKFSILYLKSPFSEVLFESDSDILSSITKSSYINDLRKDFNGVISGLKSDMQSMSSTIDKQNTLAGSIKEQLDNILDTTKQTEEKNKLTNIIKEIEILEKSIEELKLNITKVKAEYKTYNDKNIAGIGWLAKIKEVINQKKEENNKLIRLTERGKCPTCFQSIETVLFENELNELKEEIIKHTDLYKRGKEKLDNIKEKLNHIDNTLTSHQEKQNDFIGKIRSLSNMKTQLQTNLNNYKDNKKNNDDVLKTIRNTIMDLNENLSILTADHKILDSIAKLMLNKNSEYINKFYNSKIHSFNIIFKSILSKMTNGKYTDVSIKLNNKPTLNGHIEYEALSTSERKFIDISFVISYIVYLSTKLKLKTFILDEFLDNYDKENIIHIYNMIYELSISYDLQLVITTNMADYLFTYMGDMDDVKIVKLTN
jgi:DNA repair exonuclease SbcCD ATPase subunit